MNMRIAVFRVVTPPEGLRKTVLLIKLQNVKDGVLYRLIISEGYC
jgi:hypothetical protein